MRLRQFLFAVTLVVLALGTHTQAQQQSAQQNAPYLAAKYRMQFEHTLHIVKAPASVQADYVTSLGLTGAEGAILLATAKQFEAAEDALRQNAYAAINQKDQGTLARIRAQRESLLIQSAIQLLEALDSNGANQLVDDFAQDAAALHISTNSSPSGK